MNLKNILQNLEDVVLMLTSNGTDGEGHSNNLSETMKNAEGLDIEFSPALEVGASVNFEGITAGVGSVTLEDGRIIEFVDMVVTSIIEVQTAPTNQEIQMSEEVKAIFEGFETRLNALNSLIEEVKAENANLKTALKLSKDFAVELSAELEKVKETPLNTPIDENANKRAEWLKLVTSK